MYRYNITVRYMGFLLQQILIRTKLFVQLCKATRMQKDNIFRNKGEFVLRVSAPCVELNIGLFVFFMV